MRAITTAINWHNQGGSWSITCCWKKKKKFLQKKVPEQENLDLRCYGWQHGLLTDMLVLLNLKEAAIFIPLTSLLAYLHMLGMLQIMSDIKQPRLPTPFYSVLVSVSVLMTLSTVSHSINSPDNSPFSDSVLPIFISASLVLSTVYMFMKVSFSPDIIPRAVVADWAQSTN